MGASLIVVGLGPGDPALRTLGGAAALARAARIVLRTRVHPGLEDLRADPRVSDCDDLYESAASFDDVYDAIVARVIAVAAKPDGETVYAVPGHPLFGERSVPPLVRAAGEWSIPVAILPAVSFLDAIVPAIGDDPLPSRLQLVDAHDLLQAHAAEPFSGGVDAVDPERGCLVAQVHSRAVASAVKLRLARVYPEDHRVWLVEAGAGAETRLEPCAVWELDRRPVNHLTSVWVPPLASLAAARSPHTLQRIAARLRASDGCPWDRQQTHASLRQAVIEEAYETVDAIDAGDPSDLADELGDLLLQVALHAQIAEEAGDFTLEEVYERVNAKLVRRHPHVFGDAVAATPGAVVQTWEAVKAAERAAANKPDKREGHPLDTLPRAMPALQKARTLLGPRKGDRALSDDEAKLTAAGATILAAVEAALVAGIDPEQALERALWERFAPAPPAAIGRTTS